jgi:hypothetical protein
MAENILILISGPTTYTTDTSSIVPPNGASTIVVEAWGKGEDGQTYTGVSPHLGQGGRGGHYCKTTTTINPTHTFSLQTGSFSDSSLLYDDSTPGTYIVYANGGVHIGSPIHSDVGDTIYIGGNGGGGAISTKGGGGGAGAGRSNNGANGSDGPGGSPGAGANGGGRGGQGASAASNASTPLTYGGGGGGGYDASHTKSNGANGVVIVSWYGVKPTRSPGGGATYNHPLIY